MSAQETNFKAIADAIREKDGTTDTIHAREFAERIRAISTVPDGLHTIIVETNDPEGGHVAGGGTASRDMRVTVTAEAAEAYIFSQWSENGETVSQDSEYTFPVSGDRNLTAVFTDTRGSRLPEGYTEVEYIQNVDYKSYISPSKYLHYNSAFTFVFSAPQPHTSRDQSYIYSDGFFVRLKYSDKSLVWATKSNNVWSYETIYPNVSINEEIILSYSYDEATKIKTVTVNGVETIVKGRPYNATPSLPSTLASQFYSPIARFYYFKGEKDNNTSKTYNFEFIPCINPDGVAGFYDLTNEEFIAPTAGTFIPGPAI